MKYVYTFLLLFCVNYAGAQQTAEATNQPPVVMTTDSMFYASTSLRERPIEPMTFSWILDGDILTVVLPDNRSFKQKIIEQRNTSNANRGSFLYVCEEPGRSYEYSESSEYGWQILETILQITPESQTIKQIVYVSREGLQHLEQ